MNTKDFIQALADKLGVSQKEASVLLNQTTSVIRDAVSEDHKISILHLGSFHLKKVPSRSAYLPALDKKALVPPRRVIQFHPADTLKNKLKNTPKR